MLIKSNRGCVNSTLVRNIMKWLYVLTCMRNSLHVKNKHHMSPISDALLTCFKLLGVFFCTTFVKISWLFVGNTMEVATNITSKVEFSPTGKVTSREIIPHDAHDNIPGRNFSTRHMRSHRKLTVAMLQVEFSRPEHV